MARDEAVRAKGGQLSVAQARQLAEEFEPAPDAPPMPESRPPQSGS